MLAVICKKYGGPDVFQLKELPKPVPGDDEILIKIHAATVTAGDCEIRRFEIPILFWPFLRFSLGLFRPNRPLGQELAGEIEVVGKNVKQFKKGDRIYASTQLQLGAYAQYVCLPANFPIQSLPANMHYDEAATLPTGGLNGLHFVQKVQVKQGESVLINGAGGSIGTYALQIAKAKGAKVTCVDIPEKEAMLRSLGADEFIDYRNVDFTKYGNLYDVVISMVSSSSFSGILDILNPEGRYMIGNPSPGDMFRAALWSKKNSKKVYFDFAKYTREEMSQLNTYFIEGKIKASIDKEYNLDQIGDAHRYVDSGMKKGHVIIRIFHDKSADQ